ncbi:hypothetical protein JCM14076_21180 [Methylosoma difficile]
METNRIRSLGSFSRDMALALLMVLGAATALWGVINYVSFKPLLPNDQRLFVLALLALSVPPLLYYFILTRTGRLAGAISAALLVNCCAYAVINHFVENGKQDLSAPVNYAAKVLAKHQHPRYPSYTLAIPHPSGELTVDWTASPLINLPISSPIIVTTKPGVHQMEWIVGIHKTQDAP